MTLKKILLIFIISFSFSQGDVQYIDGVAAIVEDHVVLKSDLIQMVNMAAIQNKIDPRTNPDAFIRLQNSVIQSMVDQKIMLEMAELDSIVVDEKEVNQALDQQIQMLVAQAGGESQAEDALGQPIKDFRREFWYDMKDRMISERYQQQLLSAVVVTRSEVKEFYKTYKDSLPVLPMMAKVRHLQIPIKPGAAAKEKTKSFLSDLKSQIVDGNSSFSDMAKAHSLDPSKNNGGELGWVKRGSLLKNFEEKVFTIKTNTISDPIETEVGYHILEVFERKGNSARVRHILISPQTTKKDEEFAFKFAEKIKDSCLTVDDFKKYSKKYSKDAQTADIGGDLGWIIPKAYPIQEIGQAISIIKIGVCSPPVNSSYGFHLLWLEKIKPGGKPSLKNHWAKIETITLNNKKMKWYESWIKGVKNNYYIKIIE